MDKLARHPAPTYLPDPVILAAFRAAGVTPADVTPFTARHPEFAVYGPLLEPAS